MLRAARPLRQAGRQHRHEDDSRLRGLADQHIYTVNIPGCDMPGKVFVGQRQDPFAIGLGVVFDLVNAPLSVITTPALRMPASMSSTAAT